MVITGVVYILFMLGYVYLVSSTLQGSTATGETDTVTGDGNSTKTETGRVDARIAMPVC